MRPKELSRHIARAAATRYLPAGRYATHFARGKLSGDPVFTAILAQGLITDEARILDLGCGQALLAAWLCAAQAAHRSGIWHDRWPSPPRCWTFHGVEFVPRDAQRAMRALGGMVTIEVADIRAVAFAPANVVVILDVLHYMDRASQESVLARVRQTLGAGGVLLLRVGDASARITFRLSNWFDQTTLFCRAHRWVRLHCRSAAEWSRLLTGMQFRVRAIPVSGAAPFHNVLLVAQLP